MRMKCTRSQRRCSRASVLQLDLAYEEHEPAEIQQIGHIPRTDMHLNSDSPARRTGDDKDGWTIRCWTTAVIGVVIRTSKETGEMREALRTRNKWRTLAHRVLMRGRRAARGKIILEEREASRQRQVEEARQRESKLQIAIAAAKEDASRLRRER